MKQFWKFDVGIVRAKRNAKKKVGKKLIKKKKKKKKKVPLFFRSFGVPRGLQQCWAPCRATRLDVDRVKMAQNCQKMPKKGYIVMDTDCGHRTLKSADF